MRLPSSSMFNWDETFKRQIHFNFFTDSHYKILHQFLDSCVGPSKGPKFCTGNFYGNGSKEPVWPVKSRQISIKVAQKWFQLEKLNILTPYQNCLECGRFGQIHCCHRLWKVAQSPINRSMWSHCQGTIVRASKVNVLQKFEIG